ncbi:hypothetical protein OG413_15725 [Streptomyces sp. NBC_01433]|uniref:hypothetical protein n=1 Tax=Streptomyces sp. NBC_01433 TaxID=2903864 RepID=UPI0022577B5B|nr:hypothetical protein [Streptomyces sp. NBC_01433]MCX4676734.1 hypothetical protein [Streptomyces sp. NBC_01433]
MDDVCLTCHTRMPDRSQRSACTGCEYRLRSWLRDLPHHYVILQALLHPDTGPARRGGGGRAHPPLPVRVAALDLLGPGQPVVLPDPDGDQSAGIPMTALLMGWARYLAQEFPAVNRDDRGHARGVTTCTGARPWHRADVPGLCRWLTAYLPYAVTRPWIDDLYEQVQHLLKRVERVTDLKPRVRPMDAPCSQCGAFGLVEHQEELNILCTVCPAVLTPDEYLAHRDRVMPALAALALRIAVPLPKKAA